MESGFFLGINASKMITCIVLVAMVKNIDNMLFGKDDKHLMAYRSVVSSPLDESLYAAKSVRVKNVNINNPDVIIDHNVKQVAIWDGVVTWLECAWPFLAG
ncbi:hypothetical protein Tco_0944266 [Tanacetum coccineum]